MPYELPKPLPEMSRQERFDYVVTFLSTPLNGVIHHV